MRRHAISVLVLGAAILSIGCASLPIPSHIVEGTTGTIAVMKDVDVGYGRAWSGTSGSEPTFNPADPNEDLQRGETILTLVDDNEVEVARLPVRLITRVNVDPATENANLDDYTGQSQVLIAFDVPPGIVDADTTHPGGVRDLFLKIERFRRKSSDPDEFEQIPVVWNMPYTYNSDQVGWGQTDPGSMSQTIPIHILDDPTAPDVSEVTHYTAREGWGIEFTCAFVCIPGVGKTPIFESRAPDYVPLPTASIYSPSSGGALPAAWDFEVTYPAHRMSIVGVSLRRRKAGEALLSWSIDDSVQTPTTCTDTEGTLHIQIVDPDPAYRARGVNIAFKLENTDDGDAACRTPIGKDDLGVQTATAKAFTLDGTPIALPGNLKKQVDGEDPYVAP